MAAENTITTDGAVHLVILLSGLCERHVRAEVARYPIYFVLFDRFDDDISTKWTPRYRPRIPLRRGEDCSVHSLPEP